MEISSGTSPPPPNKEVSHIGSQEFQNSSSNSASGASRVKRVYSSKSKTITVNCNSTCSIHASIPNQKVSELQPSNTKIVVMNSGGVFPFQYPNNNRYFFPPFPSPNNNNNGNTNSTGAGAGGNHQLLIIPPFPSPNNSTNSNTLLSASGNQFDVMMMNHMMGGYSTSSSGSSSSSTSISPNSSSGIHSTTTVDASITNNAITNATIDDGADDAADTTSTPLEKLDAIPIKKRRTQKKCIHSSPLSNQIFEDDEQSLTSRTSKRIHKENERQKERKERRLIRNRQSAQASRERKKLYIQSLEEKVENLQERIHKLEEENAQLRRQVII